MRWRTDWKGNLVYASQAWQEFSGLDIRHIDSDPSRHIVHPADFARVATEGAFSTARLERYYGKFRHFCHGKWVEVLAYGEPVIENGIYRGYEGITTALLPVPDLPGARHAELLGIPHARLNL